ncbi:MAG: putative toxin-antitoxin system toxin component, PIN family [Bacteroidales bacterium]|jgi:putative PIN family toxin of toxin-antitoxin system|nr:putative toxin-antitoxin system toxin component, PIN family [Bacteroidales bacterium]
MANRTVFDTNIWVSYFIGKKTDEIIKMTEKSIVFLHSTLSIDELIGVLSRKKFEKYKLNLEDIFLFYTNISDFCHTEPKFKDCPDPKDNFLFDLALQGNAKYLVSGDPDVLETPVTSEILQVMKLRKFKENLQV